jgi:hypothetical protein
MNRLDDIRAALVGAPSENYRARRMGVGLGVAGGFFLAFVGYSLTANGWWFWHRWWASSSDGASS